MACQLIILAYRTNIWLLSRMCTCFQLLVCGLGAVVYSYCVQLCLLREVIACFAIGKVGQLKWNTAICSNQILGAPRGHWILLHGMGESGNFIEFDLNSGELSTLGKHSSVLRLLCPGAWRSRHTPSFSPSNFLFVCVRK